MARDLDFNRRGSRPATRPAVQAIPARTAATPGSRPTKNRSWWLMAVVVFALVVIALILYSHSIISFGGGTDSTASTVDAKTASNDSRTNPDGSALTNPTLTIDIYNSGSGDEDYNKAITALKSNGFVVKELQKSQFDYDKTYIWYRKEFEVDAKKIAEVLKDRQVILRESQIAGAFNVLVYLGKQ